MTRFSLPWAFLALAVLGLLAPGPALAAGFMVRENSAEGLATSHAGDGSRATDPHTVFANPAGMTRLQADGFELGAVGGPAIHDLQRRRHASHAGRAGAGGGQ